MADNPPPQPPQQHPAMQLPDIQLITDLLQNINTIIDRPIVEVRRQQPVPNRPPAEPWINMTHHGPQHLAIAGNNIQLEVVFAISRYVELGDQYRIRDRPVVYDINGPERLMVETTFPANHYYAIFSYGIIGCSGPQAKLLVNDNGSYLYVIDPQTAILLRNQCITRTNQFSLLYESMWSSIQISILGQYLYQWSDGNVNDIQIMNLRIIIYRLGNRLEDLMRRAIRLKTVYQNAIVWTEAMNRLPLVNQEPPLMHIVPPDVQPVPDIVVPNLQESVARITGYVNQVNQHQMFTRNWIQMFNEFVNQNTSVPIIGTEEQVNGEEVLEQMVRLTNNQEFLVKVFANNLAENNEWTYHVHSPAFMDTFQNKYEIRPVVGNFEPLVVMRRLKPPAVNAPLHSHGLAGSYDVDTFQGGKNGFQVITINFEGAYGLNHRRLYFVNRAMAMELKEMFEIVPNHPITVLNQYHRWFFQLIHMSRLVCDLRQWYRQMVQQDIGGQWLLDIQHCAQQLFLLPNQLLLKYTFISRLEQLWNHSLLVPHIENQESKVQPIQTTGAMYLGKKSGVTRKKHQESKQSDSEKPQKSLKTK